MNTSNSKKVLCMKTKILKQNTRLMYSACMYQSSDNFIQYRRVNYIRRVVSVFCFICLLFYAVYQICTSGVCIVVNERCWKMNGNVEGTKRHRVVVENAMVAILFKCYAMNSCRRQISSCDSIKHKFTLFHLNLTIAARGAETKTYRTCSIVSFAAIV